MIPLIAAILLMLGGTDEDFPDGQEITWTTPSMVVSVWLDEGSSRDSLNVLVLQ
jgi:hypothetical protein